MRCARREGGLVRVVVCGEWEVPAEECQPPGLGWGGPWGPGLALRAKVGHSPKAESGHSSAQLRRESGHSATRGMMAEAEAEAAASGGRAEAVGHDAEAANKAAARRARAGRHAAVAG